MRKIPFFSLLVIASLLVLTSCKDTKNSGKSAKNSSGLETRIDTISYLFGYSNGKNWKAQGLEDMNMAVFQKAMNEAFEEKEPKVDLIEGSKVVRDYIEGQRQVVLEENLKKSNEFLAKNENKKGVVTTDSGLQYEVIKEGTGPKPKATDKVKVSYKGTTVDGEVFDESPVDRPYEQYANRVIRGWTEGLQLMPVGSEYRFYVPPSLGYGERGTPKIDPNVVLIFDVELLEIMPSDPEPTVR